jgi:hypothetical protein
MVSDPLPAAASDPLLAAEVSPPGCGGGPSHDIDLTTWWRGASSSGGGGKGRCWLQRFLQWHLQARLRFLLAGESHRWSLHDSSARFSCRTMLIFHEFPTGVFCYFPLGLNCCVFRIRFVNQNILGVYSCPICALVYVG